VSRYRRRFEGLNGLRGIIVMAAVSRRRVRDAGFHICLPHLARHSCGLSRATFVHSVSICVTHLTRFDHARSHSLVGFRGCEDIGSRGCISSLRMLEGV